MVALVIDSSGSRQQRAFHKGNNKKTYETYVSLSIWFEASGSISTELKLILEPSVLNASPWWRARIVHLQLLLMMK